MPNNNYVPRLAIKKTKDSISINNNEMLALIRLQIEAQTKRTVHSIRLIKLVKAHESDPDHFNVYIELEDIAHTRTPKFTHAEEIAKAFSDQQPRQAPEVPPSRQDDRYTLADENNPLQPVVDTLRQMGQGTD